MTTQTEIGAALREAARRVADAELVAVGNDEVSTHLGGHLGDLYLKLLHLAEDIEAGTHWAAS